MGQHKQTDTSQGNTMDQYTAPVPLPQRPARSDEYGDNMRVPANPEEPSCAELLTAIQGSRVALEGDSREDKRAGGVAFRAFGAESPDWRSREAGQLVDAGTGRSAEDSSHRVEIQQDGKMAVVSTGLAMGQDVELG
ncbi:hypothetical protein NDU88_005937 [Pleurodeles waltl]|uniref:Uncharacterized protein n=1 Tax=Pleurodeles waltl TaxID=8319 RepID=A0AAV7LP18_PLEWA|nr:hypothetical protein NDU88_005937 [Pleurodeles waltl]